MFSVTEEYRLHKESQKMKEIVPVSATKAIYGSKRFTSLLRE
jgi:hypothetical protein